MSLEGETDASTSSLIGKAEAQAIIAALASDHNLDARLRTVTKTPSSKRPDVAVHAHYFPLRNGKPTMEEFVDRVLLKKLAKFCLPGSEIRKAKSRFATLTEDEIIEEGADLLNRAIDLFKKANKNTNRNGEFGEVIAYLLIESVLKAPQLVAKMSLKTSAQMPVHGSDGIHFNLDDGGNLRLFWGEAKCHASVSAAIDSAAESIAENLTHDKMSHELFLVEHHADWESMPKGLSDALVKFLDPYHEEYNQRKDVSVMLLAFDFEAFSKLSGFKAEDAEAEFAKLLDTALPNLVERLDDALNDAKVPSHALHLFLLPVQSVAKMRERFQNRIGWTP